MTEGFMDTLWGLSGLIGGAVIALIVFFIQRRIGKKKHWFDERYWETNNRAKARSWDATLVILLIAWAVAIIFEGISFSFFLITAIYVLHNSALIVANIYYSKKNE